MSDETNQHEPPPPTDAEKHEDAMLDQLAEIEQRVAKLEADAAELAAHYKQLRGEVTMIRVAPPPPQPAPQTQAAPPPGMLRMAEQLAHLDAHLQANGSSVAQLIEHYSRQAHGHPPAPPAPQAEHEQPGTAV